MCGNIFQKAWKDVCLASVAVRSCNASSGGNWKQEDQTFKTRFRYIVSCRLLSASVSQEKENDHIL